MHLEDAFTIISEEIDKVDGPIKRTSTNVMIQCPFHGDNTPSLSINMSFEAKVNIGTFSCFGCPAKGTWNDLAKKLDLRQVQKWQHFKGTTAGSWDKAQKSLKNIQGTGNYTLARMFEEVGGAVVDWPKRKEWRGYSGRLLVRVSAYMFNENKRDELMLLLPIYINGRFQGGVKALWDKPAKGPSYINTGGDWVQDYGLLGYDYVRERGLWGCDSIVLVEGPRDWLRLTQNKIPCCAILGSKMFNATKLMLIMALGVKKIYSLTDNDKAGRQMAKLIASVCKDLIEFEELELPRKKDEDGELIKMDPDDAPIRILKKVKEIVYEKQPEMVFVKRKKPEEVVPEKKVKKKKKKPVEEKPVKSKKKK